MSSRLDASRAEATNVPRVSAVAQQCTWCGHDSHLTGPCPRSVQVQAKPLLVADCPCRRQQLTEGTFR